MSEELEGRSPFTEEFKQQYQKNIALIISCQRCSYSIDYVHGLNSYKEVLKTVKHHLIKEHGINPQ